MDQRATNIILVPLEADAIDLFQSEAEPISRPVHYPLDPVSSPVAKSNTFDVVLAGEATDITGAPLLGHAPSTRLRRSPVIGPFRRRARAWVRQVTLFALRLPLRAASFVGTQVARAAHAVSEGGRRLASTVHRSGVAVGRALQHAASRGWAWAVAVAYLPVRGAAFVGTQVARAAHAVSEGGRRLASSVHRSGVAVGRALQHAASRGWAWAVAVAYLPVRGAAFVGTQVARAAHAVSEGGRRLASTVHRSGVAVGQALQHAASRGWAWAVAVAYLPVRGAAFVGTQVARAAHAVSEGGRRLASSVHRSGVAVGRALQHAASRGWAWAVAVAYLLVRGAAFVGTQVARAAHAVSEGGRRLASSVHRSGVAMGQSLQRVALRGWAWAVAMAALSARGAAFVGTEAARAAHAVSEGGRRLASSMRRSGVAVGRALQHAASRGWAWAVAVAYLPVRGAAFVGTEVGRAAHSASEGGRRLASSMRRSGVAVGQSLQRAASRGWAWAVALAALSAHGAAFVSTEVTRAAHLTLEDGRRIAASGRRSVVAIGQSFQWAASRGRVWLVAAGDSLQQAASSGHARVLRYVDTGALEVRHAVTRGGDRAIRAFHELQSGAVLLPGYWRALGPRLRRGHALLRVHVSELSGRTANLSTALPGYLSSLGTTTSQRVHQALQRLDGSLLLGRHTLAIRTCLSASMVGVSIAMLFVISVSRRPEVPATPAIVAAPARPFAGAALPALALATPVADAPRAAVKATPKAVMSATPERRSALAFTPRPARQVVAPALLPPVAVLSPSVQQGSPVVEPGLVTETAARPPAAAPAQAIEPVADLAPMDRERAAIAAVLDQYRRFYNTLDATSVSTIWRGLDLRALQRAFSALARQNLSFRKCDVNLASSDRARAMCTGVLSFVPRVGSEVEQLRALSWTIDLRQLDERWQIVDVVAR